MVQKKKFVRSSFMAGRHREARAKRSFISETLGKEVSDKYKYSDYLKGNENPIFDVVKVYEVSFQATYTSNDNGFYVAPETFLVYTVDDNPETQYAIESKTKDMYRNLTGGDRKELNPGLKNILDKDIYSNASATPRGFEEADKKYINDGVLKKLKAGNFHTEQLDSHISIKNKKKQKFSGTVDERYIER